MPGQEIAERSPQQELIAKVRSEQFQEQVELALPAGTTPQRFVRIAVTAVQTNERIALCDPASVFTALLKCAADGLLPDGHEAAIVDRNVKGGGKAAGYMPMIGGFRKIAGEHGWTINTSVVYSGDTFEYEEGLQPRLVHRPAVFGQHRGEPLGAYAVGIGPNNERRFVVLDKTKIEKRRNVSQAKDNGPWVTWTDEMWEKTAGKALFKKLPLGERDAERVARVIEASEETAEQATALLYGSSQQADVAEEKALYSPGDAAPENSASAPVDEEPAAPAAAGAAGSDESAETTSAALIEMPSGKWGGWTIGDIADADGGLDWFLWMLKDNQPRRNEDHAEHLVYLAARHVAETRFPEILG